MIPIPKVKGTTKPEEMRPVNTAHLLDKIIQSYVKEQLDDHIRDNELIDEKQSAYRQLHSCETAINFVLSNWVENKEQKKIIVAVFIDFSRAFETVEHTILIDILRICRIGGTVMEWFTSWIKDRKQYTKCENELSDPLDIRMESPKKRNCPLLFLLYINLIVRRVRFCKIKLFADDCLIWVACDGVEDALRLLSEDLESIAVFLKMLRLKLNTAKTSFMIIGSNNSENVHR